jgi:hypothetical protein
MRPAQVMSNRDLLLGPPISAEDRLKLYDAAEYESFITEWVAEALANKYAVVRRHSGPGDKGRDIMGFVDLDTQTSIWDNYQCKHYNHRLTPDDVWLELGRLCYYTFSGDYATPRHYYFVAPQGVGTKLFDLLNNPVALRDGLVNKWSSKCERKISTSRRTPLESKLLDYLHRFDFSIFRELSPKTVLDQHQKTRYYAARFGGGLQRARPDPSPVPANVDVSETRYVSQLLAAYSDHLSGLISHPRDLSGHPRLERHLARQREAFYRAAALRQFERDTLPDDSHFAGLKNQIYHGVRDVCDDDHETGFIRAKATVQAARTLPCESYVLSSVLESDDKAGICHHLANEDLLTWCPNGG